MTPANRTFVEDCSFDELFPAYVRERSDRYWTPVAVATRAASIFRERGAKKILDVGCGPGKFCLVAGRAEPTLELFGIEHRPRLVRVGRRVGKQLGTRNVHFSVGDATQTPWTAYDGFYFFNPFAEHVYPDGDRFDNDVDHSTPRFCSALLLVESLLSQARIGTVVLTYHGLGGPIPSSYELVAEERSGTDRVRTWVQGPAREPGWAWLETLNGLLRVTRNDAHWALASMICHELASPEMALDETPEARAPEHASSPGVARAAPRLRRRG